MKTVLNALMVCLVVAAMTGCGPVDEELDSPNAVPGAAERAAGGSTSELKASGGGGSSTTSTKRRTSAPVETIYRLATTDARDSGIWKTSYPISTTYNVFFALDLEGGVSGSHVATIFVALPDGTPYQRLDLRFATDNLAGDGESQAERTSSGYRVWAALPVAGTRIESYGLFGLWSASAHVDAVERAQTAFALER